MDRSTLVAIGALVVVGVVIGGVLVFALQPSSTVATTRPPASFASEPFPAVWQVNVTGTPYGALIENGTIILLTYGNATATPPPFGPNYPWNLLGVRASSGEVEWSHQILVRNQGNSDPQLAMARGTVYFVQAGGSLALDSANVSMVPALYALGFDPLDGKKVSLALAPTPAAFFYGTYSLVGSTAYLAWPTWNGAISTVTVESVDLLGVTTAKVLWTQSFPSGGGHTNLDTFLVDSQYVVVPFGGLYVLNAQTGSFLYNSSVPSSELYNDANGALVGGVYYFASEWAETVSPETVQLDLLGLGLANQTIAVNVTVATETSFSGPMEVAAVSGSLVVPWSPPVAVVPGASATVPFSVYSENGSLLWSSAGRLFSVGAGGPSIFLGLPCASLGAGVWLLGSLSIPSGGEKVATQYFESVDQFNGSLIWTDAFSFSSTLNTTMLDPPNMEAPPSVVPLSTSGTLLLYRWGGAVGYAEL